MRKSAFRRATVLLGALAAILAACSSNDDGSGPAPAAGGQSNEAGACLCTPGTQVACSCGNSTGFQLCETACSSYGPCQCVDAGQGGTGQGGSAGAAGAATGGSAGQSGGAGGTAGSDSAVGGSAGTAGASGTAGAAGGGWTTLDQCYALGPQECATCLAEVDSKGNEAWITIKIKDMVCKNECRTSGACKQPDCGDGLLTLIIHNAICSDCVDALDPASTAAQEAQLDCDNDPVCQKYQAELATCTQ